MDISDMRQVFAKRYYDWRLAECGREVQEGFPMLSRIPHSYVISYLDLVETWSAEKQLSLLQGLVVRSTDEAVLGGRILSRPESELLANYDRARTCAFGRRRTEFSERQNNGEFRIDRRALREQLKVTLTSRFGASKSLGRSEFRYRTVLSGVTARLHVDTGGATRQFSYWHDLMLGDCGYVGNESERIVGGLSFLATLGLAGSTDWEYLTQDQIPNAVQLVGELCDRLLRAVPILVKGFLDVSPV